MIQYQRDARRASAAGSPAPSAHFSQQARSSPRSLAGARTSPPAYLAWASGSLGTSSAPENSRPRRSSSAPPPSSSGCTPYKPGGGLTSLYAETTIRCRERSPWPLYWLQDGESSAHTSGGEESAGRPRPPLRPLDAAPRGRGSRALRVAPYPPRTRKRCSRDRRAGRVVAVHAGGRRGISGGPDRSPLRRP